MKWLHVLASCLNFLYWDGARHLYFEIRELIDWAANATELKYACTLVSRQWVMADYLLVPLWYTDHNRYLHLVCSLKYAVSTKHLVGTREELFIYSDKWINMSQKQTRKNYFPKVIRYTLKWQIPFGTISGSLNMLMAESLGWKKMCTVYIRERFVNCLESGFSGTNTSFE